MEGQLKELEQYWTSRAEGYSMVNQEELAGEQRQKWLHYLQTHFPKKAPEQLSVLDIGTGPGFFSIILAEGASAARSPSSYTRPPRGIFRTASRQVRYAAGYSGRRTEPLFPSYSG